MYVDSVYKPFERHLLRETYREGGKVKHRTVANISHCPKVEIEAIRLALRHKEDLARIIAASERFSLKQGQSVGAIWVVFYIAQQLGIVAALGDSRQGKLALWQVIARVIDQGSRLSAVRLAETHAAADMLGLETFNEDHLYANLDWLNAFQTSIEKRLFGTMHRGHSPGLYFYDVTSTYLEGTTNAFAAFGYNRDGKKGKKQIVIGLLCDEDGRPLSIEVFPGNTQDTATFASQVKKVATQFGGGAVTFVGDRGMIRSTQIQDLSGHGFHYITAITKPQIEKLLKHGVFTISLFDEELAEVFATEGIRFVLRKNPIRAQEVARSRMERVGALQRMATQQNIYLSDHPRAQVSVAHRKVRKYCEKLRLQDFVQATYKDRLLAIEIDQDALAAESKLDGCYVLKTDLTPEVADKERIHQRYKDLAHVEWAFRTCKTVQLEMRPVHVRKSSRTKGHALVVMLAYRIVQELRKRWRNLDVTVEGGLRTLATLCASELAENGHTRCLQIPEPNREVKALLEAAQVPAPVVFPTSGVRVATRKRLTENRKA